jgi:GNAT superfamily N-acetyltransferase
VFEIEPLTPERWEDFARLCRQMGPNRSCWCMWWRDDGTKQSPSARERAKALVESSERPVGLLAYADGEPVGWAAVSPREDYPRLQRGRDTGPVDDRPGVWAVPCFFVREDMRGKGVAQSLLAAAVELAAEHGASAVEGVPHDPGVRGRSAPSSYTGTTGMFRKLGFVELRRRRPDSRAVMRRELTAHGQESGDA